MVYAAVTAKANKQAMNRADDWIRKWNNTHQSIEFFLKNHHPRYYFKEFELGNDYFFLQGDCNIETSNNTTTAKPRYLLGWHWCTLCRCWRRPDDSIMTEKNGLCCRACLGKLRWRPKSSRLKKALAEAGVIKFID